MFSIILAAGKGTRMGAADLPKVCFEIEGVPAIVRSIDIYRRCGIERHIVVIGQEAEQVAATITERFPETIFAFQPRQIGTADAARRGLAVLDAFDYRSEAMVVAGDKVLAERALREQLAFFRESGADMCFMVGAMKDFPSSGRVVEDDAGNILGNLEVTEVARARLIGRWFDSVRDTPLAAGRLRTEMLEAFSTERKAAKALPALWRRLNEQPMLAEDDLRACCSPDEAFFCFEGPDGRSHRYSGDEIEQRTRYANLCVFFCRIEAIAYALERLSSANAQGEEYLPDSIGVLAAARTDDGRPRFHVVPYCVAERTDALAFNTLGELEEIRVHYRNKLDEQ